MASAKRWLRAGEAPLRRPGEARFSDHHRWELRWMTEDPATRSRALPAARRSSSRASNGAPQRRERNASGRHSGEDDSASASVASTQSASSCSTSTPPRCAWRLRSMGRFMMTRCSTTPGERTSFDVRGFASCVSRKALSIAICRTASSRSGVPSRRRAEIRRAKPLLQPPAPHPPARTGPPSRRACRASPAPAGSPTGRGRPSRSPARSASRHDRGSPTP